MRCPYRDFKECLVDRCPSCEYETVVEDVIEGRYPGGDIELGLLHGSCWHAKRKRSKFKSCKLINSGVALPSKVSVDNNTSVATSMMVSIDRRR